VTTELNKILITVLKQQSSNTILLVKVHIICSNIMCSNYIPPDTKQMFAKLVNSFVDRCLWQVLLDLLLCTS